MGSQSGDNLGAAAIGGRGLHMEIYRSGRKAVGFCTKLISALVTGDGRRWGEVTLIGSQRRSLLLHSLAERI